MASIDEDIYSKLDPFLIRKWTHAFYVFFDLNRSGALDWQDFEDLIEVIGEARGNRSDIFLTAKLCLPDIWHKLCEANGKSTDDQLAVSEWHSMWAKALEENSELGWQKCYLDYIFKLLDASGRNLIIFRDFISCSPLIFDVEVCTL
ncbi:hypothetical protein WR25_27165 isoform B [Diploscapter pachys]|uniref:EF-hand domain-containing protein n=1 Tax=Diploscapter pachys TaxID=2018661 RepID=A0A2A2LWI3_9BILA|nr:hypothetical protein WR25_27165 isoform B [Diploscapter pachys]